MGDKRAYGDYQTPAYFSQAVCRYLKETRGLRPDRIIEPTCGLGSFLKSSLIFDASAILGIEINPAYCRQCREEIRDPRVSVVNADLFTVDLPALLPAGGSLLILGNPPWVNNSTLSCLNGENLPAKSNFKGLTGMDAMTGASNFDICEFMILQLIAAARGTDTTIAMLCKTSVARNVFAELHRTQVSFTACDILEFDAKKVFGISAGACLLVITLSERAHRSAPCRVSSFDTPRQWESSFVCINGRFHQNTGAEVDDFSGCCPFTWRQGVKHDCAKVMELTPHGGTLTNGFHESVDLEPEYVFPLVKSSMFKTPVINRFQKYVIVTQRKAREDTSHIAADAPKAWAYLTAHQQLFSGRKSVIYQKAPPFSMFGVGDYSYAPYKVGVSGFYKKPLFSLLVSGDGTPVMTDDTSYFICLPTYDTAYTAMLILNSARVQRFLLSIAFLDAKRPFTKQVLQRIDFRRILPAIQAEELADTEGQLGLPQSFHGGMLEDFRGLTELTR